MNAVYRWLAIVNVTGYGIGVDVVGVIRQCGDQYMMSPSWNLLFATADDNIATAYLFCGS